MLQFASKLPDAPEPHLSFALKVPSRNSHPLAPLEVVLPVHVREDDAHARLLDEYLEDGKQAEAFEPCGLKTRCALDTPGPC